MQISRHWRLQAWRYRLEMEVPMSSAASEHQERRQFGALGVIHRQYQNENQLLVLRDEPKIETVSGLAEWHFRNMPPWGFPGGGRIDKAPTAAGGIYPENVGQTLQREIREELKISLQLLQSDLQKQAYPFLIAQLRLGYGKTDEFVATSAWLEYDQLPLEQQRLLEKGGRKEPETAWVNHEWLMLQYVEKVLHSHESKGRFSSEYRPQVLMAAYIWFLQEICKVSSEAMAEVLIPLNQKTHAFIYADAQGRTNPVTPHRVNNGSFQSDGQLIPPDQMDFRDRRYLHSEFYSEAQNEAQK